MNALEIAKGLDAEIARTVKLDILHHDAAEMIRSQSTEIERLGKLLDERGSNEARLFIRCRELVDTNAELLAALKLAQGALLQAASDLNDWGCYAPKHFRTKHKLADDVLAYLNASESARAAIAKVQGGEA